jgi:hypothetical protein
MPQFTNNPDKGKRRVCNVHDGGASRPARGARDLSLKWRYFDSPSHGPDVCRVDSREKSSPNGPRTRTFGLGPLRAAVLRFEIQQIDQLAQPPQVTAVEMEHQAG